ncbi:MAG: FtsX-like permease family protein [Lachnospiraceae bacterium]|nr:FtsX-like permease family protein [Lachnospiraceae bacterium]
MKKTYFIDIINNIKATKVSFFSIVVFVALGISIFLSFSWAGEALSLSTDRFLNKYRLHDLELVTPYGFSDEDIEEIKMQEDVTFVEGRYIGYGFLKVRHNVVQAKITSLTKDVDLLYLKEGRLPDKCGEIALDYTFAKKYGINLNDRLVFDSFTEELPFLAKDIMDFDPKKDDVSKFFNEEAETALDPGAEEKTPDKSENSGFLNTNEFTVTALVINTENASSDSSLYGVSPTNGIDIDLGVFVDKASFNKDAFFGYTDISIFSERISSLRYDSKEYMDSIEDFSEKINTLVKPLAERAKERVTKKEKLILGEIEKKENEAKDQLQAAEKEIKENEEKLKEGEKQLKEAEEEISGGSEKITEGEDQITEGEEALNEGKDTLKAAEKKIKEGEKELSEGKEEYDSKYQEWLDGCKKLQDGKEELKKGKEEYEAGKCQYDSARKDYEKLRDSESMIIELMNGIKEQKINEQNYEELFNKSDFGKILNEIKEIVDKYGIPIFDPTEEYKAVIDRIYEEFKDQGEEIVKQEIRKAADRMMEEKLGEYRAGLKHFEGELKKAEAKLAEGIDKIHAAEEEINNGEFDLYDGKVKLDDALKDIENGQKKLDKAKAEYKEGLSELNEKEGELIEGKELLEEKKKELEEGKKEFAENKKKYNEYCKQLEDAKKELSQAEEEYDNKVLISQSRISALDIIDSEDTFGILSRASCVYLTSVRFIVGMVPSIRIVMTGVFLLVSILVCYSSITRMVYSQRRLLGTRKALGFSEKEISMYYFIYVGGAALLGSILGSLLGYIAEIYIIKTLMATFVYDATVLYFSPLLMLLVSVFHVILLLLITFLSTRAILKKEANELLTGSDEKEGQKKFYEDWKSFEKRNFVTKMIINNFVTDKRRVIGTVIGIMSCTTLIVLSLTFSHNVTGSFDKHFKDYSLYNYIVYFDSDVEDAEKRIREVFAKYTDKAESCRFEYAMLDEPNGEKSMINIYIPKSYETLENVFIISPREYVTGKAVNEGNWLSYAYRNTYKEKALPDIELMDMSGIKKKVPVDGFMNFYLTFGTMIMSKENYNDYYKGEYKPNILMVKLNDDKDIDDIESELEEIEGYIKTGNYYESSYQTFETFSILSKALIALYLLLSVFMSILVLLNLLDQFVEEKKKELIIMLINGFKYHDAKRYIYSDVIVLTVFGSLLGAFAGSFLGILSITVMDSSVIYFLKSPYLAGILAGLAVTVILVIVVTILVLKKIDRFSLTDINRL